MNDARTLPSRGDIIFYSYPGASEPRHVVIYLSDDRILQAPETGQNVGYGPRSEFPGQIEPAIADLLLATGQGTAPRHLLPSVVRTY